MTPAVTIGDAILYQGDARDILPGLEKAPLIVSDVPYKLSSGGRTGFLETSFGDYGNDGNMVHCDITWPEIMDLVQWALRPNGRAYVMSDDRNLRDALNAAHDAGLKLHRANLWRKPNGTPSRFYMKTIEFALYLYQGRAMTINDCGSRQDFAAAPGTETDHRTEKPISLMQHYIENSSDPGDLVLDPFMGSGTTGVAALRCGRRFIGIEQIPRFYDLSCRRLSAFSTSAPVSYVPDLFSKQAI